MGSNYYTVIPKCEVSPICATLSSSDDSNQIVLYDSGIITTCSVNHNPDDETFGSSSKYKSFNRLLYSEPGNIVSEPPINIDIFRNYSSFIIIIYILPLPHRREKH